MCNVLDELADGIHEAVVERCREIDEVVAFCRTSSARIVAIEAAVRECQGAGPWEAHCG